ncbi:Butyryl-CoA dehydrogenase [Enhygromyxa salina]|uniref:Butyryl-CoA dehydrogenase n=1 Tax=Enhygromyxa salina TaxID=215803 RepID=A0A0C1ZS10_9BACT|nr:acyl-CoA dehydrogenase family protein [Enhygromyxa salina]KIG13858.1 Butyryl-CoA dehydrogenase [Enhygromyxa salina]
MSGADELIQARQARAVAEESRERQWTGASFIQDLFMGRFRLDLVESLEFQPPARPEFAQFMQALRGFLLTNVDPVEIDASGEYPPHVIEGLRELGAFGLKIPKDYGGLGMSHIEYVHVMELLGSHDANVTALLSAHQAIGVPQPIMLFGSPEQKRRFLPRCARGAISAFALTEPAVGSDPARIQTRAALSEDQSHYVLDGDKLWCTNGTLAELLVVMARDPASGRINAFVVETAWPGVSIEHRCRFMGLRALANAYITFRQVRVPKDNLIGPVGEGLRVALTTLNTGRLTLPAATAGAAKKCAEIVRKWSSARVQWGQPIGKHEAIAHLNAKIVSSALAMESVAYAVGELADREQFDIRLEAAAAKEWNTVRAWHLLDDTLQVRGGRGYETELSLAARGEPAIGVERALRDARINTIFEGSSEIMHLFMAREAVDEHLEIAGALVDPQASGAQRVAALPGALGFYAWWYPSRWIGWGRWPRYRGYGRLAGHLRFVDRCCRRLARAVFHGMAVYRAKLERKQAFLFRAVDVAMELFVITVTIRRAHLLHARDPGSSSTTGALELADLFASGARERIRQHLRALWHNDDNAGYDVGRQLLAGRYAWLERGIIGIAEQADELVPKSIDELLAAEHAPREQVEGSEDRRAG